MTKRDKDYLAECNPQGQEHWLPPQQFQNTFCSRCRNPECLRAGFAESSWLHRMETQPEYLLNHPIFSDLASQKHMQIHEMNFKDMFQEAMRLEIAEQRGDWEPVPIGSDGVDEPRPDDAGVDDALAALAALKGKKPKMPTLDGGIEDPGKVGTIPSSPAAPKSEGQIKKDQQLRQMARRMGVDVGSIRDDAEPKAEPKPDPPPQPEPTPEPEKEDARAEPTPEPPPQPNQPPPQSTNPRFIGNTPQPNRGIMVDDGPPPPERPTQDPWAPKPKENVVKPHHTVTFGDKKGDAGD